MASVKPATKWKYNDEFKLLFSLVVQDRHVKSQLKRLCDVPCITLDSTERERERERGKIEMKRDVKSMPEFQLNMEVPLEITKIQQFMKQNMKIENMGEHANFFCMNFSLFPMEGNSVMYE